MDIVRTYKRNIVENKNLVFICILISYFIRLCFYYGTDITISNTTFESYIWTDTLSNYLAGSFLSINIAFFFTLGIALYSTILNAKYKLIRSRTYLVYVIAILLISCHPCFLYMNTQYLALLLMMLCVDVLLASYQKTKASGNAYAIGFFLASGSLFCFSLLTYLPVFWIGLKQMRNLNFKTIVSSLLGITTIYWLAFFYYIWMGSLDILINPFYKFISICHSFSTLFSFETLAISIFCGLLLLTIIINYISNSYQDKVRARVNLTIYFILSIFSFLAFLILAYDSILYLYIFVFSMSVLLSHFFTLVTRKWEIYIFYIFISLYFILCIYFLLKEEILAAMMF